MALPIQNPSRKSNGTLVITGEEKKAVSSETALILLEGEISGGAYVFFIVWKQLSPGKYKPVYKSEIKQANRGK